MTYRVNKKQHARKGYYTQSTPGYLSGKDQLKQLQTEEAQDKLKAVAKAKEDAERPLLEAQEATNKIVRKLMAIRRSNLDIVNQELVERCPVSAMTATTPDEYSAQMLDAVRKGVARNLSDSEKQTLLSLAGLHKDVVNLTDPAVWTVLYDWCTECGVIKAEVAEVTEPEPAPEPAPTDFDTVYEKLDTSTREGRAQAKNLVIKEAHKDIRAAFYKFADECRIMFPGQEFTDEEIQSMIRLGDARPEIWMNTVRGWHTARVSAVKANYIRPCFLNADENLAWRYDKGEFADTFEGKQQFRRELAKIHGQFPVLG